MVLNQTFAYYWQLMQQYTIKFGYGKVDTEPEQNPYNFGNHYEFGSIRTKVTRIS